MCIRDRILYNALKVGQGDLVFGLQWLFTSIIIIIIIIIKSERHHNDIV